MRNTSLITSNNSDYLTKVLLYSLLIGVSIGTITYLYNRQNGHKGVGQWYLSVMAFFALAFLVLKYLV